MVRHDSLLQMLINQSGAILHPTPVEGLADIMQSGAVWPIIIDVDGDGRLDVLVDRHDGMRLHRQLADGSVMPVLVDGHLRQPAVADYDGDGDVDILSVPDTRFHTFWIGDYDNDGDLDVILGSRLYRNNLRESGRLTFTDVTGPYGAITGPFLDLDNDGDLDLFIAWSHSRALGPRNESGRTFPFRLRTLSKAIARSCNTW